MPSSIRWRSTLNKVDAQQARRILDRLVGYKISPLLWDKVRRGLSAGRVQSVALRILCDREREIAAFVTRELWSLTAQLDAADPPPFVARLVLKEGRKIELVSKDEVAETLAALGWRISATHPLEGGHADAITVEVAPADGGTTPFRVVKVESKEKKKTPPPPFITSKLQQDAARALGYPVAKTMRLAQGLYEGRELGEAGAVGLITYMRTDSTRVSDEALTAVREYIGKTYGAATLPEKPRFYRAGKQAQGAHEAIRPTSLEYTPDAVKEFLGRDELRLYTLIWNRFVASQMEVAVFDTTRADIEAGPLTFRATGQVLKSPGWLAVYHEGKDEDASQTEADAPLDVDSEEAEDAEDRRLPVLREGQELACGPSSPAAVHPAAAPLFRGGPGEEARGGRHRPPIHVRADPGHHPGPQLRGEGEGTLPAHRPGHARERPHGDLLPRDRGSRLHGAHGRGAGPDRGRRAELDRRSTRVPEEVRGGPGQGQGRDAGRQAGAIPTDLVCDKCGKPMVLKWGRFGQFLACSAIPTARTPREVGEAGLRSARGHGTDRRHHAGRGGPRRRSTSQGGVRPRPTPSRRRRSRARSAAGPWC
jgi:DNA topoisomerase-1